MRVNEYSIQFGQERRVEALMVNKKLAATFVVKTRDICAYQLEAKQS